MGTPPTRLRWVDTHCHLDAPEFSEPNLPSALVARSDAAIVGVAHCVIPSVSAAHFAGVRALAHQLGDSYCLGIHPLRVAYADEHELRLLEQALGRWGDDARLVGVGEIGLDGFAPGSRSGALWDKQLHFLRAQLTLARRHALPLVLHGRGALDTVLKHVRELLPGSGPKGIAHAFNGSLVQAQAYEHAGLCLGFGGALTYARARRLQSLARSVPLSALVLETDAPDMAPAWCQPSPEQRGAGARVARNEPAHLPRIGAFVAQLRGLSVAALADASTRNACAALPRLTALLV